MQPQLHPYFPYGANLVGPYQPATGLGYRLPYGYTAHSGCGGFYPNCDDGFYPKGDVGFYPGYSHASYGSQSGGAVTQTNSGGVPYVVDAQAHTQPSTCADVSRNKDSSSSVFSMSSSSTARQ